MSLIKNSIEKAPLAERMRPTEFDAILGQEKIWSSQAPLRRLAEEDSFYSLIFWGPPGTGKTSVATLMGAHSQRKLIYLSAVNCGVKDIREAIESSLLAKNSGGKTSLLFLDEIHRLSKNQQDVLLPSLEKGDIRMIGATTENPSFTVNNAILSRSLVFRFELLLAEKIMSLLKDVVKKERGDLENKIPDKVYEAISQSAGGDARRALNLMEAVLSMCPRGEDVKEDVFQTLFMSMSIPFDRKGEHHYDTISAFIKCVRASQPDAALHYLAKALVGGEDPEFLARRLIILASEDIGNANPHALVWANSAADSLHRIGMPEGRIVLGQITTLLACSPKSNRSYVAINEAMEDARNLPELEVPLFLRNAPTQMMKDFDYGKGYIYAHSDPKGAQTLDYLPKRLKGKQYYKPSENGHERNIKQTLETRGL